MHAQGTDHTAEFGTPSASVLKLELYKFVHVCETAKYDKKNGDKLQKDDLKLRQSQNEDLLKFRLREKRNSLRGLGTFIVNLGSCNHVG